MQLANRTENQGRIKSRVDSLYSQKVENSLTPDFPNTILVEIGNVCNHGCVFCAYTKMTRPNKKIDLDLLFRLLNEGFDEGARELGLYSGAEPFASRDLEKIIQESKSIGYEYVFVSTNGSLANEKRIKDCIDSGLDSIKVSINGGNREVYRQIHGLDHFDRVIRNLQFMDEYRKTKEKPIYIAVSFVIIDEKDISNKASMADLKKTISPWIDEFNFGNANDQNGQMLGLEATPITIPCTLPFHRVHISAEGYLRACCSDYQNYLALVDLKDISLKEAWHSMLFQNLRKRHLDNNLDGTLCHNCAHGANTPIAPLDKKLATVVPSEFFDWKE